MWGNKLVTYESHDSLIFTVSHFPQFLPTSLSVLFYFPLCSNDISLELRQRNRGDLTADSVQRGSHHGLEQYLSRFEEAMKLRKQLISEKPSQEDGNTTEEFDSFRIFRLVGCALLAFGVRAFVCKYLVRNSGKWKMVIVMSAFNP